MGARSCPARQIHNRGLTVPERDLQALLDGWAAEPVPGWSSLHREQREFDHQSAAVGECPTAERTATRDDEIRGSGDRFGRHPGVERAGTGGEHTEQSHGQSPLAETRLEGVPEVVPVGDRSMLDLRRHRCPRIDDRGDCLPVLVQHLLAYLLHVPRCRCPTGKNVQDRPVISWQDAAVRRSGGVPLSPGTTGS